MSYLNTHPEVYNPSYDGHELFLNRFFAIVRIFMKKIFSFVKMIYRNILHWWVQLVSKISSYSDKVYMKSRDKFMEEVVKDKRAVPHFWDHLKKYKREIDEEEAEKEEEEAEKEA
jgi:hypothetical protein